MAMCMWVKLYYIFKGYTTSLSYAKLVQKRESLITFLFAYNVQPLYEFRQRHNDVKWTQNVSSKISSLNKDVG